MSKIVKGWVIFLKVVLEDAEVMSGLCCFVCKINLSGFSRRLKGLNELVQ